MNVDIGYEGARKHYPNRVNEVLAWVRKSSNKLKKNAPETFRWKLEWAVQVEMTNGGDFLKMMASQRADEEEKQCMSEDETVADMARRSLVHLTATVGRTAYCAKERIKELPKEIEKIIREDYRKDKAEQARIAKLTPAKRDEEINGLLRELSKGPGFMMFPVPRTLHGTQ